MSENQEKKDPIFIYLEGLNGILAACFLQSHGQDVILALEPRDAKPIGFFPIFVEKTLMHECIPNFAEEAHQYQAHIRIFEEDENGTPSGQPEWRELFQCTRSEQATLAHDQLKLFTEIFCKCLDNNPGTLSRGETQLFLILEFAKQIAKEKQYTQDYLKKLIDGFSSQQEKVNLAYLSYWLSCFLMKSWEKGSGFSLLPSIFLHDNRYYRVNGDFRHLYDRLCAWFHEKGGKILNTSNYEQLRLFHSDHSFHRLRTEKFELTFSRIFVDAPWVRFRHKFLNMDDVSPTLRMELTPPASLLNFLYIEANLDDPDDIYIENNTYFAGPDTREDEKNIFKNVMNDGLPGTPSLYWIKQKDGKLVLLAYPFSGAPNEATNKETKEKILKQISERFDEVSRGRAKLILPDASAFDYAKAVRLGYKTKAFGKNPFLKKDDFFGMHIHETIKPSTILGDNLYFIAEGLYPTMPLKPSLYDFLQRFI